MEPVKGNPTPRGWRGSSRSFEVDWMSTGRESDASPATDPEGYRSGYDPDRDNDQED